MTAHLLLTILSFTVIQQPTQAQNQEKNLRSLLVASGVHATLMQAQATFTTALDTLLPAGLRTQLRAETKLCSRAFDPDSLSERVLDVWRTRLLPETVEDLLLWYSQAPGSRVRQREEFLLTANGAREYHRYEEWLKSRRPSLRRRLLLQRLEGNFPAQRSLTLSVLPLVDSLAATHSGSSASLHGRLENVLKRMVETHWLFVFQNLTNDQLQAYNEFLERGSSAAFLLAMRQGLERTLTHAADQAFAAISAPQRGVD